MVSVIASQRVLVHNVHVKNAKLSPHEGAWATGALVGIYNDDRTMEAAYPIEEDKGIFDGCTVKNTLLEVANTSPDKVGGLIGYTYFGFRAGGGPE